MTESLIGEQIDSLGRGASASHSEIRGCGNLTCNLDESRLRVLVCSSESSNFNGTWLPLAPPPNEPICLPIEDHTILIHFNNFAWFRPTEATNIAYTELRARFQGFRFSVG